MKSDTKLIKLLTKANKNLLELAEIMNKLGKIDDEKQIMSDTIINDCCTDIVNISHKINKVIDSIIYKPDTSNKNEYEQYTNNDASDSNKRQFVNTVKFSKLDKKSENIVKNTIADFPITCTLDKATVIITESKQAIIKENSLLQYNCVEDIGLNKRTINNYNKAVLNHNTKKVKKNKCNYILLKQDIKCGSIIDSIRLITGKQDAHISMLSVDGQALDTVLRLGRKK